MSESDWSQFIPDLTVAFVAVFFALIIGGVVVYLKSDKFKKWFDRTLNKAILVSKWLIAKWPLIFLHSLVVLGIVILRIYMDWRILTFSLICYVAGLLSWGLSIGRPITLTRRKSTENKTKYLPIPLIPGIGNSYLHNRYLAPPSGDIFLGKAQFRLGPDALIFDTNEQTIYFTPRSDGGKEVNFRLPKPQNQVKSAYVLVNSSNSKSIYAYEEIGEIRLVFEDAPPIVVELILGKNVREWCPGNPGDFVRDASSPMMTLDAWKGLGKNGANAVMDCLKIPVYECMHDCFLEKIIFIYKPTQHPTDTMGVHFSVFAVSLEIEQRM